MKRLLRAENVAFLLAALVAYRLTGGNWWLFAILILLPDLSMLGYFAGPRLGAWCYNAAHSWIAPIALFLTASVTGNTLFVHLALILAAHIAADRALGYGLKYESGFGDTHLGRIGADR